MRVTALQGRRFYESDGSWGRDVLRGHSMAFRGAQTMSSVSIGCHLTLVSPPHFVSFRAGYPAPQEPDPEEKLRRRDCTQLPQAICAAGNLCRRQFVPLAQRLKQFRNGKHPGRNLQLRTMQMEIPSRKRGVEVQPGEVAKAHEKNIHESLIE